MAAVIQLVGFEAQPALIHVEDKHGTAVCGEPAKLENIVPWGGDHNCRACAAIKAASAWKRGN